MPKLPFEAPRMYAERRVIEFLKRQYKPCHVFEIAEYLRMDERLVRQCASNLRKMGESILSGNEGYWMARSPEEIEQCVASLHRRALQILTVMAHLKKNPLYTEMVGQLKLALEEK